MRRAREESRRARSRLASQHAVVPRSPRRQDRPPSLDHASGSPPHRQSVADGGAGEFQRPALELPHAARAGLVVSQPSASGEARLRAASERMTLTRLFGERVYQLRLDAGLTRTQLARRCRVSTETIRKTEFGHGGEPGLVLILTVCGGLRVAPGALLAELPTPRERRP